MSRELVTINELKVTSFWGGEKHGKSLQFTVGRDYSVLRREEAKELVRVLKFWLKKGKTDDS